MLPQISDQRLKTDFDKFSNIRCLQGRHCRLNRSLGGSAHWQDLDGDPFTFHARGTGSEAIGDIIIKREGSALSQRSDVPDSENRIVNIGTDRIFGGG